MSRATTAARAAPSRRREWGLALLLIAPLVVLTAHAPIPQDPRYHAFADTRVILGIPNFSDLVSNRPFLLVGIAGWRLCREGRTAGAARAWSAFFAGVALVCPGSAWYHWSPSDGSLAWDRLPITVAFTAMFTALAAEHVAMRLERWMLVPAVALGAASVAWWVWMGDLRFYIWVQAAPLAAIVYFLVVYPPSHTRRACLVWGIAAYAAAKAAEFHDAEIFALSSGVVSGHTLKHLLAALAAYSVYVMLRGRRALPAAAPVAP